MPSLTPVLEGSITEDGIVVRLSELEEKQTTGALLFEADGVRGEVALVRGQFASEQAERDDGQDSVELLLELRSGRFEVVQRLPQLPVSSGDDQTRTGSLAVHVTADLMNYCETAGLTGLLTLTQEERVAEVLYERGEMTGIRLDGDDDDDLNEVFGWDSGSFRLEATAEAPDLETLPAERPRTAPPPARSDSVEPDANRMASPQAPKPLRTDTTGVQFLRVVEKSLTSILDERELHRPTDRVGPPLIPLPSPSPPSRSRRDATVRVIYLGAGDPDARPASPSALGLPRALEPRVDAAEEGESDELGFDDRPTTEMLTPALDVALPPPSAEREEAAAPSVRAPASAAGVDAAAFAWALVVLTLALGALGVLAQLPLLE